MIKKAGHIFLIGLLLLSTMGVTMYKHYCGASFVKQTISILPNNCCKGSCDGCHNETKQFKITDSFEANTVKTIFKSEITKLFNHGSFAIILVNISTYDISTNNLSYKVKTCENFLSTKGNSPSLLQVFRL